MLFLASVEAMGLKPIYETLDRLGLPRDPFFKNETLPLDISYIVGRARRVLGLNLFIKLYISEDIRNTTKNKIMVSP